MLRVPVACAGCGEPFTLRVGTDSTEGTRFYFPCPYCRLPTRAYARGDDIETFKITFTEATPLDAEQVPQSARVVTANPFVPAKYDADWTSPEVAMSMITLSHLLGPETMTFMEELGQGREAVASQWPAVRRLYEYYLDENWSLFDRTFARNYSALDLPSGPTQHERATRAHHPLLGVLGSIVSPSDRGTRLLLRYANKHTAAVAVPTYRAILRSDVAAHRTRELQRLTFDVVDLFIARREMWAMGGLRRLVEPDRLPILDELTLPRDEFGETRDLFQQAFEAVCKSLRFLVIAQNAAKRGDAEDFGEVHPEKLAASRRATTLKKFDELPNAYKIAYVRQVPGWEVLADVLDSHVRNTIGHATARHDLRTGRVVSDKDVAGIPYLQFVSGVHSMFEMLALALQVLRFATVAGSEDFNT
jgi:hypothetical protein